MQLLQKKAIKNVFFAIEIGNILICLISQFSHNMKGVVWLNRRYAAKKKCVRARSELCCLCVYENEMNLASVAPHFNEPKSNPIKIQANLTFPLHTIVKTRVMCFCCASFLTFLFLPPPTPAPTSPKSC